MHRFFVAPELLTDPGLGPDAGLVSDPGLAPARGTLSGGQVTTTFSSQEQAGNVVAPLAGARPASGARPGSVSNSGATKKRCIFYVYPGELAHLRYLATNDRNMHHALFYQIQRIHAIQVIQTIQMTQAANITADYQSPPGLTLTPLSFAHYQGDPVVDHHLVYQSQACL